MKNLNLKPFVSIIAVISIFIFLMIARIKGCDFTDILGMFGILPAVFTIDAVICFVFVKWLWRWKYFQGWLVPFPDLSGTWQGTLCSTWKSPSGKSNAPIKVILCIQQSFLRVSCVMRSSEMSSHSYAEGFWIDSENQILRLCYTYTSRPLAIIRDRSAIHDGTTLLEIKQTSKKLIGEYWTQRGTVGVIDLVFREEACIDILPNDF